MNKKINRIGLGFIGIVFLINFHYYSFYPKDYKKIFKITETAPRLLTDQYLTFQKYHPFADLFFLVQNSHNRTIHYLFTRYDSESILEDELFIRVNYFFYPRIIQPVTELKVFLDLKFNQGDLIISDRDLILESLGQRLKPIPVGDIATISQDYFFRRDMPYYLYEVIK